MGSEGNLRFMTWNINGTGKDKIKALKQTAESADVVFLQETHYSERLNPLETVWNIYHTTGLRTCGVAILIKKSIPFHYKIIYFDDDRCYVVVICTLREQKFTLISLYNPQKNKTPETPEKPEKKETPLKKLKFIIEHFREGFLVIAGDFNTSLNPELDRNSKGNNQSHDKLRDELISFMEEFRLVDVWRKLHPEEPRYTYLRSRGKKIKSDTPNVSAQSDAPNTILSRLDYVLVSKKYMKHIPTCDISKDQRKDHIPVYFEINFENLTTTTNPQRAPMISKSDVANALQSLEVFDKHAERPDGRPLSYYLDNKYIEIPILCEFYNSILDDKPENIPDSFSKAKVVEDHYRFNVNYLILATIIAKKLDTLLESPSEGERGNEIKNIFFIKKSTFMFHFEASSSNIKWDFLKSAIDEEIKKNRTDPLLSSPDSLTKILSFMLKTRDECKVLRQGCPLTRVLKLLYLKYVAIKLIKRFSGETSNIYISRENVIAWFPVDSKLDEVLKYIKSKYSVECSFVELIKKK